MAIAEVLRHQVAGLPCACLQVDEANIPGNPNDAPLAVASINRVLDGFKGMRAVHLCFGNYGGQTIQRGGWRALIAFLNQLHVDHVILEMAHRPAEDLAPLRDVEPRIKVGFGGCGCEGESCGDGRGDRGFHRARRGLRGRGPRRMDPPGLRLLDAQTLRGGPQDAGAGERPRPVSGTEMMRRFEVRSCGLAICRPLVFLLPLLPVRSYFIPKSTRHERKAIIWPKVVRYRSSQYAAFVFECLSVSPAHEPSPNPKPVSPSAAIVTAKRMLPILNRQSNGRSRHCRSG